MNDVLYRATDKNHVEIVEFILNNSTGTPIGNHGNGETPLWAACRRRNIKIVDPLVQRFPYLTFVVDDQNRRSPLHFSCHHGDVGIVNVLLAAIRTLYENGISAQDLNIQDIDGRTPLYNACYNGQLEVVKLLLEFKSEYPDKLDVNVRDLLKRTVLHAAISAPKFSKDIVELLLSQEELAINVEALPSNKVEKYLNKLLERKRSLTHVPPSPSAQHYSSSESYDTTPPVTPLTMTYDATDVDEANPSTQKAISVLQSMSLARPASLTVVELSKIAVYKSPKGYLEVLDKLPPTSDYIHFKKLDLTPLAEACVYRNKELVEMLLSYGAVDTSGIACHLSYIVSKPSLANMILSTQCNVTSEDQIDVASAPCLPVYSLNWCDKHLCEVDAKLFATVPLYSFDYVEGICQQMSHTQVQYSNIHTVNLQNNCLQSVPLELFQLPNVYCIDLSHNEINQLPEANETYSNVNPTNWKCMELCILKLSSNKLQYLPSSLWLLPSLKKLFSDENELKSLLSIVDPSTFNVNICPLEEINLSRNHLEGLQNFLFYLPQLTRLDLSYNRLVSLPQSLWDCESLQKLKLSHNQLSHLPKCEVDELHDMSVSYKSNPSDLLHLANPINVAQAIFQGDLNRQTSIYKDSSLDKRRTKSNVNKFKIRQVYDEIEQDGSVILESCDYSNLTHIDLSYNNFKMFPQGLPCLAPNLTELDVSRNKFTTIDIVYLPPCLRRLTAANCMLLHVGNTLTSNQIKQIQRRCYYDNDSSQCLHRSHTSLQYLQTLKLSGNQIRKIQLMKATLKRNTEDPTRHEFDFIPNSEFVSFNLLYPSLEGLDLTDNDLQGTFNPNICRQTQLKWIRLSNNRHLEELPLQIALLKNTRRLTQIEISNLPNLIVPPKDYQDQKVQTGQLLTYMRSRLKK